MSEDDLNLLLGTKIDLLHKAIRYSSLFTAPGVGDDEMEKAERNLCHAAKSFAHAVDGIDPKLWEPPSINVDPAKI